MSRRRRPQHHKSGTAQPESWLLNALGGAPSATGISINSSSAMRVSAVFAAVNLVAQDVAKLPLLVKEINPDDYSKSPRHDHPLYRLLHVRPNRWQTRFEFRELETVCLLLHGNSYTYKRYNSQGQIIELIPIHPSRVTLMEAPDGGLLYQVSRSGYHENAVLEGAGTLIPAEYICHIRGLSLDGLSGVSVLSYARESLGLALATEAHSAKLFGNGARPGGVLKVPQILSDQAYDRLRSSWQAAHGGVDNAWRTAILEAGTEWQPMSMTAEDLQFIESRKFQVEDIARFFRVPPHKLQDLSRATFCLPAGTSVFTEQGPYPIETVTPGQSVWSHDGNGWVLSRVSKAACSGEDEILHIRTTNRAIRANGSHRLLVRRKVDQYRPAEWKNEYIPAGELKVGDTLICADRLPGDGVLPQPQPSIGFMEFCGLLLGDGNVYPKWGVSIARAYDAGYMDHYRAVMRAEFRRYDGGNGRSGSALVAIAPVTLQEHERQTRFASVLAARRLERLGFCGTARTKQVPEWVFMLPESHRLAFVRGFLDADGSVDNKGRISFSSCNETLLNQIRHLCISCGVPVTNMRCQTGKTTLPNGARIAFSQWVFVCSDPGQNRRIGSNDPRYVESMESGKPFDRKGRKYPRHGGRGFDLAGCSLSRIVSITREPAEPVYDLEVEGTHNFIADGVVVHNSNIEHLSMEFVSDTLGPWLARKEAAYERDLLSDAEQGRFTIEHDVHHLLRGDSAARASFYTNGRQWGYLSANDCRRLEGMKPIAHGDDYLQPLNMMPTAGTQSNGQKQ